MTRLMAVVNEEYDDRWIYVSIYRSSKKFEVLLGKSFCIEFLKTLKIGECENFRPGGLLATMRMCDVLSLTILGRILTYFACH